VTGRGVLRWNLPMYRVSPQPFVTREHIISEIFSSCSTLSPALPGDVTDSRGLKLLFDGVPACESLRCNEGLGVSRLGFGEAVPLNCDLLFSASLRSIAPRSLRPASSSEISPDTFNNCSMRPRRFSRPSMYFALSAWLAFCVIRRRVSVLTLSAGCASSQHG